MSARLLLVEDEPINRELFRSVLDRAGDETLSNASVREAATLAAAREAVGAEQFDLVVIDVRLPDGNGLDLARELSRRDGDERPRIVVLSASVLPAERSTAFAAGAHAFLGKPYTPGDLEALLASQLAE